MWFLHMKFCGLRHYYAFINTSYYTQHHYVIHFLHVAQLWTKYSCYKSGKRKGYFYTNTNFIKCVVTPKNKMHFRQKCVTEMSNASAFFLFPPAVWYQIMCLHTKCMLLLRSSHTYMTKTSVSVWWHGMSLYSGKLGEYWRKVQQATA